MVSSLEAHRRPILKRCAGCGVTAYAFLGAGSYSYVAVGASGRTYEALAKPVRRRLLFAGEHTSMEVTTSSLLYLQCRLHARQHDIAVIAKFDALTDFMLSSAH